MKLDDRIRQAEARLFARFSLRPDESYIDLASARVRLRVLSTGAGPSLVLLHGVSLAAAVWAPWLTSLAGYRAHLVELPGHGLSGPVGYQPGAVRDHSLRLMDDLCDALGLAAAPVVGHSLGGMFALWYAAARPHRIASLAAIGEPAVALPGVRVRMPLSLLTVPLLGEMALRSPIPRPVYRRLLGQGLSPAAAATAPAELLDVLRYVPSLQASMRGRRGRFGCGRTAARSAVSPQLLAGCGAPGLLRLGATAAITSNPGSNISDHSIQE